MSKYELCVVLSAKLEEEEKNSALERVKEFVTRAGGTITDSGSVSSAGALSGFAVKLSTTPSSSAMISLRL